ncbi:MAG: 3-phosphoserine/phosphohydroxythreonine transaminase, partial [Rhodothermales bacterium]
MSATDRETLTPTKTSARLHNFSAGPAVLPEKVLQEVKDELPAYRDVGASVMEISHRSATYTEIEQDAKRRIRRLLGIGEEWHVLFLQGGASMQFYQVPLNFLPDDGAADYLTTGRWSVKALDEAEFVGDAREVASSEDRNFSYIPPSDTWDLNEDAAYLHFTSNNTVVGTQFREEPVADVPLICDASSDFLSRPLEMGRYGLIYAGAQKNVGPAGATVVLIHDAFLQQRRQPLPTMLDYGTHTAKLYNTP